ncbi:hypothetical protein EJ08DRAFT_697174 [Tothia fuscella]|uniref:DUF7918 domain-containing protein n=1 Tax=Tothia fuscella TaxID=1048955 RepID=A0A9P4NS43_9PEZI|nr:hypothetical protein EJ08DRAFT_697174 [Tothia fuscella]
MAVLSGVTGLSVTVRVDSNALKEYPVPEDDSNGTEKKITKYIEAQAGAHFSIQAKINRCYNHQYCGKGIYIQIDGQDVDNVIYTKTEVKSFVAIPPGIRGMVCISDGMPVGSGTTWTKRKFKFSELTQDERPASSLDKSIKDKLGDLGSITVSFCRLVVTGDRPGSTQKHSLANCESILDFGAAETTPANRLLGTAKIDQRDSPLATFVFKYRSLADLKAEGIIPRSPSPIPLEDRPIDELNPEEMRELLKRQSELLQKRRESDIQLKTEIKRERDDSSTIQGDDNGIEVVEERSKKKAKIVETIDLTDD